MSSPPSSFSIAANVADSAATAAETHADEEDRYTIGVAFGIAMCRIASWLFRRAHDETES